MKRQYCKIYENGSCMCKVREKCHNSNNLLLKEKQRIHMTFGSRSPYFNTICEIWIHISIIKIFKLTLFNDNDNDNEIDLFRHHNGDNTNIK